MRSAVNCLECRQQGRCDRSADARKQRLHDRACRQYRRVDRNDEVQVVDRSRHEPDQLTADGQSAEHTDQGTDSSQHTGLAQHHRQHLAGSGAQRAQNADATPALYYGEADGPVDQQRAHEQGQQAHGFQVGREGRRHVEIFARTTLCLLQLHAWRELRTQGRENPDSLRTVGNADIDARQTAGQAHPFLCLRYVGQKQ